MSQVYASTRPLFGDGPQTPLHRELEEYAHRVDVQQLLHELLTEIIITQPEEPIPFMISWLQAKRNSSSELPASSNTASEDVNT